MAEQVLAASVIVKVFIKGELYRQQAQHLLRDARLKGITLIGPPLLVYEVETILQRQLALQRASVAAVDASLRAFYELNVQLVSQPGMVDRARQIARQHTQDHIYDALYCALAELRKCEYWTADRTFYEAVRGKLAYVRYLPNYV